MSLFLSHFSAGKTETDVDAIADADENATVTVTVTAAPRLNSAPDPPRTLRSVSSAATAAVAASVNVGTNCLSRSANTS